MAKGRRLTTSRSERLLGSYTYGNGQENSVDTELGEDDVWSMVDDVADRSDPGSDMNNNNSSNFHSEWSPRVGTESNGSVSIRSRQRIPRSDSHAGGLSLAFENPSDKSAAASRIVHQLRGQENRVSSSPRQMATSAPVNVPDWSKIYRVDSVESLHDSDEGYDSEMVPPHEYLARAYARNEKNGGASVFEGVGRTLKGRDLRRVRDAVWSQTGFDG